MSRTHIDQTGEADIIPFSDGRLTILLPIQIKRRSGRKLIKLPNGEVSQPPSLDSALTSLQLALVRGYRWLAMLQSGEVRNLRELAAREGIHNSYVSRIMNMTLLAPDIIDAILDDVLPKQIILFKLAVDPPPLWEEQRKKMAI